MKKNYLKPLCMTTPMRGLRLLEGSLVKSGTSVNTASDIGWSREQNDYPQPTSVWDD